MKMHRRALKNLQNERGIAVLETIPLLVVFTMLVGFALGLFGVIHTGVLHSIAARTYAFETMRNRTSLYYFREDGTGMIDPLHSGRQGWRFHAIQSEGSGTSQFIATGRHISFGRGVASTNSNDSTHNSRIFNLKDRNTEVSVSPSWVMVGYGICLNATCGN